MSKPDFAELAAREIVELLKERQRDDRLVFSNNIAAIIRRHAVEKSEPRDDAVTRLEGALRNRQCAATMYVEPGDKRFASVELARHGRYVHGVGASLSEAIHHAVDRLERPVAAPASPDPTRRDDDPCEGAG
jgi:hypothetical protein